MRENIEKLLNSDVSGYRIYKETGISQSRISDLRNGRRKLDNLTFANAEKLYNMAKKRQIQKFITDNKRTI
ncbi:hypothetical protein [Staphylococcus pettenkoferi]|uniref:hypothetical protein n=1 Tax=Staphylococcus pettenkoferi TaxID=170573 RepID=UPI00066DE7B5|nr:hypothetical protein [Staphylococcus pettenkoferi]MCY1566746.1 hypothetical protein [Staphylococcus pettenkoferi]MCY1617196.1 hypothetical protein [Staphylococcus pettenkoferi]UIK47461.1 hypothetical protein LFM57_09075 [Staphylococcus pettenkoferi]